MLFSFVHFFFDDHSLGIACGVAPKLVFKSNLVGGTEALARVALTLL